jgi:pyruvate formate lyase activating enzyme
VTRQVGFADAVVAGCQSQGIHTVIETCGACSWPHLQRLVEYTDLVRNDVTLLDEERHHQCAGGANQHILPNARRLAPCNAQIHVPLIPGITDTEENHGPIFSLMRELGLTLVALLPHNPSTTAKYKWLCLPSEIVEESRSGERLAEVAIMAQETGLEGTIG